MTEYLAVQLSYLVIGFMPPVLCVLLYMCVCVSELVYVSLIVLCFFITNLLCL